MFRQVVGREVEAVRAASAEPGRPAERVLAVFETFAQRALKAPRLAYALLAEPVDALVEAERLVFRRAFTEVVAEHVAAASRTAVLPPQDGRITAAALVGAVAEVLVGPLDQRRRRRYVADAAFTFVLRALGGSRCRATHEVTNQVPPLTGHDVARRPGAARGPASGTGAGWAAAEVHELGRLAGSEQAQEWGRLANENAPVLRTHDRYGNRIDEVEFHPHWHDLMTVAVSHGLHGAPWQDRREGAHVGAGGEVLRLGPGRGRAQLPDFDDVRGGAGAAGQPGAGRAVRAAAGGDRVRLRAARAERASAA